YHLNRQEYEPAIGQFEAAAKANPRLPFVHFNLGLAYLGKQDYSKARDEFLKDIAIEPDLALNYEQLGDLYWQIQEDKNAEKSYRQALSRDPRLASSCLGLAKIYQRQQKYAAALAEADAALKADPARTDALGRQVKVGNLSLALWSGSVAADNISIADDPKFSNAPFVQAKSLKVGVELLPLIFSKTLNIRHITLDQPQISLVKSENGDR